jgi:ferredoxin-type protein NapG
MVTRKKFLQQTFRMMTGAVADAVESRVPARLAAASIRPPGAVSGIRDACTSCGECVDACPEQAIQLAPDKLNDKSLPIVLPSLAACVMCEDLPCVSACEDGALVAAADGRFPSIGLAHVQRSACLAHNGSTCMTCYDACTLKRAALRFKLGKPLVDPATCTGCGQCERACPLDAKGIVVEAR